MKYICMTILVFLLMWAYIFIYDIGVMVGTHTGYNNCEWDFGIKNLNNFRL